MKKMNLTRSLLAACSIVAISAVMYGCSSSGEDDARMDAQDYKAMFEAAAAERDAALAAQVAAETAQAAAETAQTDAETAQAAAETAQSAAETAQSAAETAQADAEAAQSGAEMERDAANVARGAAQAAQAAAEAAQADAETAQAAAEAAAAAAAMAQATAEGERDAANAAAAAAAMAQATAESERDAANAAAAAAAMAQATAEGERDAANAAAAAAAMAQATAEGERDAANAAAAAAATAQAAAEAAQADAEAAQAAAEIDRDLANAAAAVSEQARMDAEAARTAAEEARLAAELAKAAADADAAAAEQRAMDAEAAQADAEAAQADAEAAQETAEGERDAANDAADEARMAQETAEGERDAANDAADEARMAQETAEGERDAANDAADEARMAQETAEGERDAANDAADEARMAQETAEGERDAALMDTGDAQKLAAAAVKAQMEAERLQGVAEDAQTAAEAAQTVAEDARDAALLAQGVAEGKLTQAEADLTQAQADLKQAQADLKDAQDAQKTAEDERDAAKRTLAMLRGELRETESSDRAQGLLAVVDTQTEDGASADDALPLMVTATNTAAGGVSIVVNPDGDGDSDFEAHDMDAPTISGWPHQTQSMRADDDDSTEIVAIYTDVGLPGPKSLLLDEMAGQNSFFTITDGDTAATDFVKNASTAGLPSAPDTGSTTVLLGESTTPIGGGAARLQFSGTWRGVPGTFVSTDTDQIIVTARLDEDDEEALTANFDGGTWTFQPDNVKAMVAVPDEDYIWFGWWKDEPDEKTGDPASFAYGFRTAAGGSDGFTDGGTTIQAIEGKATYVGAATGKFAMETGSRLAPTYDADAFTATARLTADFGGDPDDDAVDNVDDGTIKGSITDFQRGDGSALAGWKVTLNEIELDAGGADFASTSQTADDNAVAEIGGIKSGMGGWSGSFFGNGRDDGQPDGVVGRFDATFTGANAHIAGSYGARNDD